MILLCFTIVIPDSLPYYMSCTFAITISTMIIYSDDLAEGFSVDYFGIWRDQTYICFELFGACWEGLSRQINCFSQL
jgi:hypothetical protein